jgi:GR25 family glycosyltransferase involved in LPS biosynthesis
LGTFILLSPLVAGFLVHVIYKEYIPKSRKTIFTIGALIVFSITYIGNLDRVNYGRFYFDKDQDRISEIKEYLGSQEGRILVEVSAASRAINYLLLDNSNPSTLIQSSYIVFRESAVNSIFMVPIINSFSNKLEEIPFHSLLSNNASFLGQSMDVHIERASFLGINHFILSSDMLAANLMKIGSFVQKDFGNITVLSSEKLIQNAEILSYEPAVLFSPIDFKKRSDSSFDYVSVQEEVMYQNKLEVIIVAAHEKFLDISNDLDKFKTAIVTEYSYHDIEAAFTRLSDYSLNNTLILIVDEDPLFDRLKHLPPQHRIYIFNKYLPNDTTTELAYRNQIARIINLLDEQKIAITDSKALSVEKVQVDTDQIDISIKGESTNEVPVLIRYSYFPAWKNESTTPVYLATPAYMMTFTKGDIALRFTTPWYVYFGYASFLLSLCCAIYFYRIMR